MTIRSPAVLLHAAPGEANEQEVRGLLFIGDDWAEEHHDIELVDEEGRVLARTRLSEGIEGVAKLHALVAEQLGAEAADLEPAQVRELVKVGIETDRGPWVAALVAVVRLGARHLR